MRQGDASLGTGACIALMLNQAGSTNENDSSNYLTAADTNDAPHLKCPSLLHARSVIERRCWKYNETRLYKKESAGTHPQPKLNNNDVLMTLIVVRLIGGLSSDVSTTRHLSVVIAAVGSLTLWCFQTTGLTFPLGVCRHAYHSLAANVFDRPTAVR